MEAFDQEDPPVRPKAGIVAFSFGLRRREDEPNPSNKALARAVRQAYIGLLPDYDPIIVSQWEVGLGLVADRHTVPMESIYKTVEPPLNGDYLDSAMVWAAAKVVFDENDVDDIVIVAQKWLHYPILKFIAKRDGYHVLDVYYAPIPFDDSPENTQPWTWSRLRLLGYTVDKVGKSIKQRLSRT